MCKQKGAQLEEHARTQLSSDTEEVAEATGSHTWCWLSVTQRGTGGRSMAHGAQELLRILGKSQAGSNVGNSELGRPNPPIMP